MKVQKIEFDDLSKYKHPSILLFRYIELNAVYQLVKKHKFKNPALDLGCGDGYLTSILFDSKFAYGLDNDEAGDVKVAIGKKLYKKVLIESATDMSLKSCSVNFVFSNSVIEHIPDNDVLLNEVSRVLKQNGKFLFTVPTRFFSDYLYVSNMLKKIGLVFLASKYVSYRNKMLNHYHLYDYNKWKDILEEHGLVVESYKYYLSKEAINLWDKMALQNYILGKIRILSSNFLLDKYFKMIKDVIASENYNYGKGGGIVILARKK